MRYFIRLAYKGTNYHGWQIQPNDISVQEEINNKLSILLKTKTEVVGCGRTDTGVHAKDYYAHFEGSVENTNQLKYKLNRILSDDIAIKDVFEVAENMHARFSAQSRSYEYHIHQDKSPFKENQSWYMHEALNVDLMNEAAKVIIGKKDFSCFSKSRTNTKTNICDVNQAYWVKNKRDLVFHVTADRFLRNMVRAIVGTLIDVGIGKLSKEDLEQIIASQDRRNAGISVPAKGLYLSKIEYTF